CGSDEESVLIRAAATIHKRSTRFDRLSGKCTVGIIHCGDRKATYGPIPPDTRIPICEQRITVLIRADINIIIERKPVVQVYLALGTYVPFTKIVWRVPEYPILVVVKARYKIFCFFTSSGCGDGSFRCRHPIPVQGGKPVCAAKVFISPQRFVIDSIAL